MADNRNLTMMTDLYELTMMQGYFKNPTDQIVVFDAFYRTNPCNGGYAICLRPEQVIDYIRDLHFSPDDIEYLRSLGSFDDDFLEYLRGFHFTGDIYAIPEGTVVFPREPLVKVVAPIMEAQLVEPALLNIINHQSLIATKASRVVDAAKGDGIMEFGLRRAQGPDAGIWGARAAVIGGCVGTSNVLTGEMFGVPVKGTHAHSWIMSFPDELTAFRTYAKQYPNACILLVDTYDVLRSGVPNAIKVFTEMRDAGIEMKGYGIRIDSGDLAYLSKKSYEMLAAAGFEDAIISASSDLDEYLIDSLKQQGAKINSWGVGTNLITSNGWSAFGGVYKMAAIKNKEETGKIRADLISLAGETFDPEKDLTIFAPDATWKKTKLKGGTYRIRELLVPIFKNGLCVYESPSVMEIRDICTREKETLWEETMRLTNPQEVYVDLSDQLYDMKKKLFNEMSMKD